MTAASRRVSPVPAETAGAAGSGRDATPSVRRRGLRLALVLVLVLAAALPGGAAYAWWSGSGAGSGTASAGTLQALVMSGEAATPTAHLLPGQTGSLSLLVHNPNDYAVRLVAVTRDTGTAISVSGGTGCTAENSGVSFTDQTGLSITVTTGVGWQEIDLPDSVTMAASSDNGCQGASFAIPVTLTVRTP